MRPTLDTVATIAIIATTVAVGVAAVHRTFGSPVRVTGIHQDVEPQLLSDPEWQRIREAGNLVGDSAAPIVLVEFADLECPYCARFHAAIREAQTQFGRDFAYVFVHYPLIMHRFARPAARAAECAKQQAAFGKYVDVVFAKQDSLGLKSWVSYAVEAGVQDTVLYSDCVEGNESMAIIDRGRQIGDSMGIQSTPTVLINGWRLGRPPYEYIQETIDQIVNGRDGFKASLAK